MLKRANVILISDDDQSLRRATVCILEEAGYCCIEAENGKEALSKFRSEKPDLVILDVMMPKMDGFEVCERIREIDELVPVLFFSAKGDIVDKRSGFRAGADDYLVKPFSEEELVLRVKALLRRAGVQRGASNPDSVHVIRKGNLEIDLSRGAVQLAGLNVVLTPKEFRILAYLAEHPGEVVGKDELIEAVWGEEYLSSSISIPVYIRRIREKLEDAPSNPKFVHTVWGVGYYFGDELAQ